MRTKTEKTLLMRSAVSDRFVIFLFCFCLKASFRNAAK